MSDLNPQTDDGTNRNESLHPSIYSASSCAIMQTKRLRAEVVREQVDQRIAELESEIRALKTHRNTVADTSPLPAEILSIIFIILRRAQPGVGVWWKLTWVRVTHVCRHWRAVALACPALWSDLVFVGRSPTFTEVMLQRSKNAPLTVDFATYPPPFNDILCKITSQTNRLRDVVLRQDPNTALLDLPKILSSFESTAPILEKLVLQGADLYNGAGTNRYSTIPANFLQDGAPSLQHLDITRFAIHWDTLPLSITLTHLRLENVVPGNRPTRKLFSETLAKLLRLETIKISACLPHSGDASQPDSLPIILPSLRTLELQDFVAELRQFFSVTQIPQKAKVDLELSDEVLKSESLGSLFSALRASWTLPRDMVAGAARNSAQPDILDLRVVDSMTRCIPQIMCWFNNHDLPPNFDVENPPANLTVSTHTIAIGLNILLKAIAGRFGISSLRSFKIASNCIVLTRDTLELVKGLPKLDRIAIWNRHDVLSEFLGVLKKKKDHVLAFPSLRSIELHGIDFDEDLAGDSDAAIQALAAVLKSRKKIRSTIKRFAMTQCVNFLEHHWEVIQAALPKQAETYWDEDEHIIDPSEDEEEFEDSSDYGGWGY